MSMMSLLFLKFQRLPLVEEAVIEDEAVEVVVVDEVEVEVVEARPPSAATVPPKSLLLPLQRVEAEFEAEAEAVDEPETLRLLNSVHFMIVEQT